MRLMSLLLSLCGIGLALGQGPGPMPAPGKLHVQFQGDPGVRFSYLQGPGVWKTQPLPVRMALQPGARYIFKVEGVPGADGQPLYPTLEVLDSLYLPPSMRAADYPAPINIGEADALAAGHGSMVTKVITLEDPEGPYVGLGGDVNGADAEALSGQDPLAFSREVGRALAILRLGNKVPTEDDLSGRSRGWTTASCLPSKPLKFGEECLRDGGDLRGPAHLDTQGKLKGLEPADTVMTFADHMGRKHILPTNPTCVCVPRFVSLRGALPLAALANTEQSGGVANGEPGLLAANSVKAEPAKQIEDGIVLKRKAKAAQDIGSDRIVSATGRNGTRIIGRIEGAKQFVGSEQQAPECQDGPLELLKTASSDKAHLGDVITFTIKYANKTCQPIHDVALVDSLTARLVYIAGSQKSSRESIFVTQNNEAGSLILRWEIKDPIPAGGSGEVTFQARVK
jgi:uncharacterized repeat protein (TIGR01451 family)